MDRGQELFLQKRYDEAAQAFEAAYQAQPYPAFLYNQAVCLEKAGQPARALDTFARYLAADPNASDADKTRARIARLQASLSHPETPDAGVETDASTDAASNTDAGSAAAPPLEPDLMKSLVIVESDPDRAPVSIYARSDPAAPAFAFGQANAGWKRVLQGNTPLSVTLDVGRYHILMEPFADYHHSETDLDVAAGHVHHFKANLRQGEFLAFLRVTSPEDGARIYLDDPPPHQRPPWGVAPHEGMVGTGRHQIWVERAGYRPETRGFTAVHGDQHEEFVHLTHIDRGMLRIEAEGPDVSIEVDGRESGVVTQTNLLQIELGAGRHTLHATASGRKTLDQTVEVFGGQVLGVSLVMVPRYPRGAAWTEAIGSAALLTGGIFLGLEANSVYHDLQRDRDLGILTADDGRYTKGRAFAISSTVCYGLGGVLAAISAYNFIRDPVPPSAMRLSTPYDYPDPARAKPPSGPPARSSRDGSRRTDALRSTTRSPGALHATHVLQTTDAWTDGAEPITTRPTISIRPTTTGSASGLVLEGRF